jgi:hypothetical protein
MNPKRAALRVALKKALVAAGAAGVIPRRVARGLLILLGLEHA